LLRAERQTPAQGDVLDLGCGYGPLAAALATRAPGATIWAVDINRRAVELTTANAAELGLDNIRACVPEDVPAEVQFTALWSNPPIRVGKVALHDLLRTWLSRLRPDGVAHLVVHKHLGGDSLSAWLHGEGWDVERTASKQGYRLLRVAPGAGSPPPPAPVGDSP
ncbi:MAG: class I SAM-dependent methyltransferase, partial [Acidimicrobiales bacterium]